MWTAVTISNYLFAVLGAVGAGAVGARAVVSAHFDG